MPDTQTAFWIQLELHESKHYAKTFLPRKSFGYNLNYMSLKLQNAATTTSN